jgi:endonuclease YncB( thermonuclease family)
MYEYNGFVERVVDGDTVIVRLDLGFRCWVQGVRVRLLEVFAPELGKGGEAAKAKLEELLPVGASVFLQSHALDRYGRSLGYVFIRDNDNDNVNHVMRDWLALEAQNVD